MNTLFNRGTKLTSVHAFLVGPTGLWAPHPSLYEIKLYLIKVSQVIQKAIDLCTQ